MVLEDCHSGTLCSHLLAVLTFCVLWFSRFMICCDCCGEWYHGDCIGITVSQGKRMERAGEDYVCVSCQERERKRKEQKEADRIMRLAKREQAKEKDTKNVIVKVCVGVICTSINRSLSYTTFTW